ncbi:MAG: hypothetical protein ACLQFR_23095 [Streptosporangiaceae bacterium]
MNEDVSQLIREGLDRLTAGATSPPGLAAAALLRQRRYRRMKAAVMAVAATAAIATSAAVALVAASGTPQVSTKNSVNLTAFVISQTRRALARPRSDAVVRAAVSQPGVSVVSWSDQVGSRTELTASTTGTRQAGGYVVRDGSVTVVIVNYADRTWRAKRISASRRNGNPLPALLFPMQTILRMQVRDVVSGCHGGATSSPFSLSWGLFIRRMLSCGTFTVAGRGRVAGLPAIRLVSAASGRDGVARAVLWVSSGSYLPLRLIISVAGSAAPGTSYEVNLQWLPATAANRAKARILPAPIGFRQLPWPHG